MSGLPFRGGGKHSHSVELLVSRRRSESFCIQKLRRPIFFRVVCSHQGVITRDAVTCPRAVGLHEGSIICIQTVSPKSVDRPGEGAVSVWVGGEKG